MTERSSTPGGIPTGAPFLPSVERLRSDFDRLIDLAVETGGKAVSAIRPERESSWQPVVDVAETSDEVLVRADIPGVDPGRVEIFLVGNMLTISGEKVLPVLAEQDAMLQSERPSGKFSRSLPMPASVNPEVVSAESKLGVLTIRLAKAERAKPKQIHVTVQQA